MNVLSAHEFAIRAGIPPRTARYALSKAAKGGLWHGEYLPVVEFPGKRGGAAGKIWGLVLDAASPSLKERLGVTNPASISTASTALERPIKPSQTAIFDDKRAIIQPILDQPKGTGARTEVYQRVSRQLHSVGGKALSIAEPTLRQWVQNYEHTGGLALLPRSRADLGKRRVQVSRVWDNSVGLPQEEKLRIAAKLEATAKGLIVKDGTSLRRVVRLCQAELIRLTAESGVSLPKARMAQLCKLHEKWAKRYAKYRVVHEFDKDHKTRHKDWTLTLRMTPTRVSFWKNTWPLQVR